MNNAIELALEWFQEIYPEDVFTGTSGDEGALRVAMIQDALKEAIGKDFVNVEKKLPPSGSEIEVCTITKVYYDFGEWKTTTQFGSMVLSSGYDNFPFTHWRYCE